MITHVRPCTCTMLTSSRPSCAASQCLHAAGSAAAEHRAWVLPLEPARRCAGCGPAERWRDSPLEPNALEHLPGPRRNAGPGLGAPRDSSTPVTATCGFRSCSCTPAMRSSAARMLREMRSAADSSSLCGGPSMMCFMHLQPPASHAAADEAVLGSEPPPPQQPPGAQAAGQGRGEGRTHS